MQPRLEEERGQMKVAGGGEIGDIQLFYSHLCHRSEIGEYVAALSVREDERHTGTHALDAFDVGQIDAAFAESGKSDFAHFVASDSGDETNPGAECGEIMGQDGRGAAEGDLESTAQQLALGRHLFGQAVEDQVEIGFSYDGDVEGFDRLAGNQGILGRHKDFLNVLLRQD